MVHALPSTGVVKSVLLFILELHMFVHNCWFLDLEASCILDFSCATAALQFKIFNTVFALSLVNDRLVLASIFITLCQKLPWLSFEVIQLHNHTLHDAILATMFLFVPSYLVKCLICHTDNDWLPDL